MTFLLRAYSDGDGDLTARVRCSAFTHEVKAVDFWRRLGRLLGPFVNSTLSFDPSNQAFFSTQGRPDAEKLTGKMQGASGLQGGKRVFRSRHTTKHVCFAVGFGCLPLC
jgi:hypothetical protein